VRQLSFAERPSRKEPAVAMVRLTAPETEYLESTAQAEVRVAFVG